MIAENSDMGPRELIDRLLQSRPNRQIRKVTEVIPLSLGVTPVTSLSNRCRRWGKVAENGALGFQLSAFSQFTTYVQRHLPTGPFPKKEIGSERDSQHNVQWLNAES